MEIEIDINDPIPVYEQIVFQIQKAIIEKRLLIKSPLPSIRQLAEELGINPGTVAKAYQILESNSVIITAVRKGTFVKESAVEMIQKYKAQVRVRKIKELIFFLKKDGINNQEIKTLFIRELRND